MAPAVPAGRATAKPPLLVFKKYPSPSDAVKPAVLIVVCQSTVPVLPKPVCEAPVPKVTVSPDAPIVIVLLDSFIMSAPHAF